jgi:hypothetical protein
VYLSKSEVNKSLGFKISNIHGWCVFHMCK